MKKLKEHILRSGMLILCLVFLLQPAAVHAEISDDAEDYLKNQVTVFLEQVSVMTDEQLDAMAGNGGFYEVFTRSWKEEKETLGDLVFINEPVVDDSDPDEVIVNTVVEFKNYTADVIMYFAGKELSPKNYEMNVRYSMKEKMKQAGQNMVVGLIVVFVILVFLMFVISLFRFLPNEVHFRKKGPVKTAEAAAGSGTDEKETVLQTEAVSGDAPEEEIAAVIAAAIAAASEEAPSHTGYVVRSVRRYRNTAWKRA